MKNELIAICNKYPKEFNRVLGQNKLRVGKFSKELLEYYEREGQAPKGELSIKEQVDWLRETLRGEMSFLLWD